ncbi:hypothetical protein D1007_49012 [Hordeum vulgare]|uniref:Uncharacterized protein n=1 Tax=Hordeum vulgare subsp. vulgare TaxID=112509 RepID=A0A8I6WUG1_HORVV|nr:uncharacterized protein LOC123412300 [Hordeum vulgare subsp. vulgare]KAE8778145.1 hypothetical protein D1007_49012 [Hordeum vulgare]KAI5018281.1 hypothetical protein ZWY2020_043169 [Hordeum vulgare]
MAGASATSTRKGGIKAYWKHRGYDRLDAAAAQRRPPLAKAELGAGEPATAGRRRGWRVRRRGLGRRLLRALSPRRLLARLRDAYVSAMLRLASSAAVGYGSAPFCAGAEPFARPRPLKEYDEKVLVEMYRSILARGGVIPLSGDAALVVGPAPMAMPAAATVA